MRSFILSLGCLVLVACTANVSGFKQPIAQRVSDACAELDAVCASGGDCLPKAAFCGPATGSQLTAIFLAEDTCKIACNDEWSCLKTCKGTRVSKVNDVLASTDISGVGTVGTGTSACTSLNNTCTSTGTGCTANEFFCVAAAPAPSPCATDLESCKASCNHDRTCTRQCRADYRSCLAGSTMDAGMTTTSYNLTYGTTAGSTGTGTVTVNPAGASCGANCSTYAAGTMVTLTATANAGSTFTSWQGCTSTTNTCTVTMSAAMTVTATFSMNTTTTTNYNLTVGTTSGSTGTGTIAVSPAGTSCGANCYTYAAGTSVKLTATPATGSTFTSWQGCTSNTNTCTVTVSANMTVTATFTKSAPAYTYTTDIAPKMTGYCNGCHSGGAPYPGNYATDSYTNLLGNGSDNTPNIIPGDVNSKFVQYMLSNHKNVLTVYPGFDKIASDWVVLSNAAK
ncbi:MAG TPA: hypothetical protein VLB44_13215 [Kofleriaceae bacterium]|nr:hypothetical protein [Kofleriaceae bacterium]